MGAKTWMLLYADRSPGEALRVVPALDHAATRRLTKTRFPLNPALQGSDVSRRFWAPPQDAREALWRLHRFNLTWGMFAHGALLIPLVSYGNYLAQKRAIRRQEEALIA